MPGSGTGRVYFEVEFESGLIHQMLKYAFGGRAATNITQANENNFIRIFFGYRSPRKVYHV
jgi:hypothetical protein